MRQLGFGVGLGYAQPRGPSYVAPLDVVGASAAGAYGLRLLRSAYSGPLFRISRGADLAEIDISADSSGGFNQSAVIAHAAATNNTATITGFYDQSGNGRTATQATVSQQFLLYDSAWNLFNGLPVPFATNKAGIAAETSRYSTSAITYGSETAYSQNAVVYSVGATMRCIGMIGTSDLAEYLRFSDGNSYPALGRTTRNGPSAASIPGSGSLVFTHTQNGTNHVLRRNGTVGGTFAVSGSNDTGNKTFWLGYVNNSQQNASRACEWTFWFSALGSTDATALDRNQGSYWGISVA